MAITINMDTVEKINRTIIENVDSKYKSLIDPTGFDKLKKEISDNPELQKYFKL